MFRLSCSVRAWCPAIGRGSSGWVRLVSRVPRSGRVGKELLCFESLSRTVATALASKRANDLARKARTTDLATESAGVGLWSSQIRTGHVWGSPRLRRNIAFAPTRADAVKLFPQIHPGGAGSRSGNADRWSMRLKPRRFELEFRLSWRWTVRCARRAGAAQCCFASRHAVLGALIDVTGLKLPSSAATKRERLRLVLSQTAKGCGLGHRQSRSFFSPRYSGMLGYEARGLFTRLRLLGGAVHPYDLERVNQPCGHTSMSGRSISVEIPDAQEERLVLLDSDPGTWVEETRRRALEWSGPFAITASQTTGAARESDQRFPADGE